MYDKTSGINYIVTVI